MPEIIKKCFLYHYDSSINSDKVFNLFLIDNEDGTFSALQEFGRKDTRLNVKPLAERCSLNLAQNRYAAKRFEKINHRQTPYLETLSCSYSPTVKKYASITVSEKIADKSAKVIDFKAAEPGQTNNAPAEKESGEQQTQEITGKGRRRARGALNLDQLDALEL